MDRQVEHHRLERFYQHQAEVQELLNTAETEDLAAVAAEEVEVSANSAVTGAMARTAAEEVADIPTQIMQVMVEMVARMAVVEVAAIL